MIIAILLAVLGFFLFVVQALMVIAVILWGGSIVLFVVGALLIWQGLRPDLGHYLVGGVLCLCLFYPIGVHLSSGSAPRAKYTWVGYVLSVVVGEVFIWLGDLSLQQGDPWGKLYSLVGITWLSYAMIRVLFPYSAPKVE